MTLLTHSSTDRIKPGLLVRLGWRTVWLHRALTDPPGEALAPRDRELLVLVATSALGVDTGAAVRHLRRFGTSEPLAIACIGRLAGAGYLSLTREGLINLPGPDLDWIAARTGSEESPG
ncbi:hypothetical protein [Intrasporangium sp.]|uniref:hypothetical protein n=1 Tax=Intrasporangium sp. TaxID=1925024 RepID=UPI003221651D